MKDILPTPPPSRVVAKQGRVYGVGVFVANLTERMDPRAIDVGARVAEDEPDIESQARITIAGEDALLVRASGGVLATGVAGDCSAVTLVGDESQVRAVAERIQRAD